jgi:DNA-binding transcriptional ArsR family regulator
MPLGIPSYLDGEQWSFRAPPLFGTKMRTALLMLIAVLEETYPGELSRYLKTSISSVQRTLDKIEDEGIISTRPLVVRAVTLNPMYPAVRELRSLLLRLAEGYPEYDRLKESRRSRPRKRKKPL